MKSYFLIHVQHEGAARMALSKILPVQAEPWVLFDPKGNAVAYFNIDLEEDVLQVQVDISGRHYNEDLKVIRVLRELQKMTGGIILDDFDNII